VSGPVFMFCTPGLIFGGTEGIWSRFHVLQSRTRIRRYRGHRVPYRTHFWLYRGRRVPFSCFSRPDSFSVVPRASGPVFMFCAPGLIFDGIEGVRSRFQVLRSQTYFRRLFTRERSKEETQEKSQDQTLNVTIDK
jgi:hypothetical protein